MGFYQSSVVVAIEREFGVTLSNEEVKQSVTFDHLQGLIWAKISDGRYGGCLSSRVFYQVRKGLIKLFGIPRDKIRTDSRLEDIIPRENRKQRWSHLSGVVGLRFPELLPPGVGIPLLLIVSALVIYAPLYFLLLSLPFPSMNMVANIALLLVIGSSVFWVRAFIRHRFPLRTVKDLVRDLVLRNHLQSKKTADIPDRQNIQAKLKNIIARHLYVSEDKIKPEDSLENIYAERSSEVLHNNDRANAEEKYQARSEEKSRASSLVELNLHEEISDAILEAYGFSLKISELVSVNTVGQLYTLILNKISNDTPQKDLSRCMFGNIRKTLAEYFRISEEKITQESCLEDLIPKKNRCHAWDELSKTLDLDLPRLAYTKTMYVFLFVILPAICIGAIMFCCANNGLNWVIGLILIGCLYVLLTVLIIPLVRLLDLDVNRFPDEALTVKQLVTWILYNNSMKRLSRSLELPPSTFICRREAWARLARMIQICGYFEVEEVRRELRFDEILCDNDDY